MPTIYEIFSGDFVYAAVVAMAVASCAMLLVGICLLIQILQKMRDYYRENNYSYAKVSDSKKNYSDCFGFCVANPGLTTIKKDYFIYSNEYLRTKDVLDWSDSLSTYEGDAKNIEKNSAATPQGKNNSKLDNIQSQDTYLFMFFNYPTYVPSSDNCGQFLRNF